MENHQGPVAHWDVGNPAAPVSPKGDDQRRAFLTFTEVWGLGSLRVVWGNIVFDVYEGLLMGLEFFCWCLRCSLSFFGVGGVRGAVGSVVLGCFGIVEFFFVMVTACILWQPTLRHFWETSFLKTELCGFGCMITQPFPLLTSMSQSCNVTIPAPCRPNACPVHWQNWAVPKQWSIFARRYSNGHQKWWG